MEEGFGSDWSGTASVLGLPPQWHAAGLGLGSVCRWVRARAEWRLFRVRAEWRLFRVRVRVSLALLHLSRGRLLRSLRHSCRLLLVLTLRRSLGFVIQKLWRMLRLRLTGASLVLGSKSGVRVRVSYSFDAKIGFRAREG